MKIEAKFNIDDEVFIINKRVDCISFWKDKIKAIHIYSDGLKYETSNFYEDINENELMLVKDCTPDILYKTVMGKFEESNKNA